MPLIRKNKQKLIDRLNSWSSKDEELAGLPDPLGSSGPPEEVVKLWEKSFLDAIAADKEYWDARAHGCGRAPMDASSWLDHVDPTQLDVELLRQVLEESMQLSPGGKLEERRSFWSVLLHRTKRRTNRVKR